MKTILRIWVVSLPGSTRLGAAMERKSLPEMESSLINGTLRYALGELASLPRAAVVVEDRYSQVFNLDWVRPATPTGRRAAGPLAWRADRVLRDPPARRGMNLPLPRRRPRLGEHRGRPRRAIRREHRARGHGGHARSTAAEHEARFTPRPARPGSSSPTAAGYDRRSGRLGATPTRHDDCPQGIHKWDATPRCHRQGRVAAVGAGLRAIGRIRRRSSRTLRWH